MLTDQRNGTWVEIRCPELPRKSLIDKSLNLVAVSLKVNYMAGGFWVKNMTYHCPVLYGPVSHLGSPSGRAAETGAFRDAANPVYNTSWVFSLWPLFSLSLEKTLLYTTTSSVFYSLLCAPSLNSFHGKHKGWREIGIQSKLPKMKISWLVGLVLLLISNFCTFLYLFFCVYVYMCLYAVFAYVSVQVCVCV